MPDNSPPPPWYNRYRQLRNKADTGATPLTDAERRELEGLEQKVRDHPNNPSAGNPQATSNYNRKSGGRRLHETANVDWEDFLNGSGSGRPQSGGTGRRGGPRGPGVPPPPPGTTGGQTTNGFNLPPPPSPPGGGVGGGGGGEQPAIAVRIVAPIPLKVEVVNGATGTLAGEGGGLHQPLGAGGDDNRLNKLFLNNILNRGTGALTTGGFNLALFGEQAGDAFGKAKSGAKGLVSGLGSLDRSLTGGLGSRFGNRLRRGWAKFRGRAAEKRKGVKGAAGNLWKRIFGDSSTGGGGGGGGGLGGAARGAAMGARAGPYGAAVGAVLGAAGGGKGGKGGGGGPGTLDSLKMVAGAAGKVVGAFVDLTKATYQLAKSQEQEIRRLAEVGAQQSAAVAQLDAERTMRDIKLAKDTGDSSKGLAASLSKFEDVLEPIEAALMNIANTVGTVGLNILGEILEPVADMAKLFNEIAGPLLRWFGEEKETKKAETPNDWFSRIAKETAANRNPRWPQGNTNMPNVPGGGDF